MRKPAGLAVVLALSACAHINPSQSLHVVATGVGCMMGTELGLGRWACGPVLAAGIAKEVATPSPDWHMDLAANFLAAGIWSLALRDAPPAYNFQKPLPIQGAPIRETICHPDRRVPRRCERP